MRNAYVVVGSLEESDPFVRRTICQGVDLVYDGQTMKIVVRYQKNVCVVSTESGKPRNYPSGDLTRIILFFQVETSDDDSDDDDDNDEAQFIVGVSFGRDGFVYKTKVEWRPKNGP